MQDIGEGRVVLSTFHESSTVFTDVVYRCSMRFPEVKNLEGPYNINMLASRNL